MIYIDTRGQLWDDEGGAAQATAAWPKDARPATDDEIAAARAIPDDVAAAAARAVRDDLLRNVYDAAVAMLQRASRLNPANHDQYMAKLAEFDAWAVALQAVPDQPGFPHSIDWPEQPTAEAL